MEKLILNFVYVSKEVQRSKKKKKNVYRINNCRRGIEPGTT